MLLQLSARTDSGDRLLFDDAKKVCEGLVNCLKSN